ncbi:MAG TPA: N-acetyltransferase, partial [Pseudonocardiaceae bacterium]|nr:N-acetyltransferase [Pseudonocardiaceae bacterium]
AASLRLSEKLGYRTDGANIFARRGVAATEIRLVLEPSHFVRPDWTLQADGLDGCRQMLGVL